MIELQQRQGIKDTDATNISIDENVTLNKQEPVHFHFNVYEKILSISYIPIILVITITHGSRMLSIRSQNNIEGVGQGMFGYLQDQSDSQWKGYLENISILVSVNLVYIITKKLIQKCSMDLKYVHYFTIVHSSIILIYIFRMQCVIILILSMSNYLLTIKLIHQRRFYLIIHAFNFLQIILIRYLEMDFNTFSQDLQDWMIGLLGNPVINYNILYNLSILRQISFSLEYYYVLNKSTNRDYKFLVNYQQNIDKHIDECQDCKMHSNGFKYCQKMLLIRISELEDFNLLNYLSYLLYIPTYFTGPILQFNHYIYQLKRQPYQMPFLSKQSIKWLAKLTIYLTSIEVFSHLSICIALKDRLANHHIFMNLSLLDQYLIGIQNFIFLHLKFLFIWNTSLYLSQLAGIDTVCDMKICIYQTTTISQFWRNWHRSFNTWILRYIFIPMNGNDHYVRNVFIVFTYVALWHDFNSNLVVWAYLLIVGIGIEHSVQYYFKSSRLYHHTKHKPYYKYLVCMALYFSAFFLISSNNYGFGVGFQLSIKALSRFVETSNKNEQLFELMMWSVAQMMLMPLNVLFNEQQQGQKREAL